jgi:hypothetical protein
LAQSAIDWSYVNDWWRGHWSWPWWVVVLVGALGVRAGSRGWLWMLRLTFLVGAVVALYSFSAIPSGTQAYDVFDREVYLTEPSLRITRAMFGLGMLILPFVVRVRHDGGSVDGGGAGG